MVDYLAPLVLSSTPEGMEVTYAGPRVHNFEPDHLTDEQVTVTDDGFTLHGTNGDFTYTHSGHDEDGVPFYDLQGSSGGE